MEISPGLVSITVVAHPRWEEKAKLAGKESCPALFVEQDSCSGIPGCPDGFLPWSSWKLACSPGPAEIRVWPNCPACIRQIVTHRVVA